MNVLKNINFATQSFHPLSCTRFIAKQYTEYKNTHIQIYININTGKITGSVPFFIRIRGATDPPI